MRGAGAAASALSLFRARQESQASSWVEAWNSACLSRCPRTGNRDVRGHVVYHFTLDFCAFGTSQLAANGDHIPRHPRRLIQCDLATHNNHATGRLTITMNGATNDYKIAIEMCIFFNGHIAAKDDQITIEGITAFQCVVAGKDNTPS